MFQGDLIIDRHLRVLLDSQFSTGSMVNAALVDNESYGHRWDIYIEDGTYVLPYEEEYFMSDEINTMMEAAFNTTRRNFELNTCLRLKPRTHQNTYISFNFIGSECKTTFGRPWQDGVRAVSDLNTVCLFVCLFVCCW